MTLGSSILLLANNMMTDGSLGVLKRNKRISKDDADNLECTIKIRQSTVDVLKEFAYENNLSTYDQIIVFLIRGYRKKIP